MHTPYCLSFHADFCMPLFCIPQSMVLHWFVCICICGFICIQVTTFIFCFTYSLGETLSEDIKVDNLLTLTLMLCVQIALGGALSFTFPFSVKKIARDFTLDKVQQQETVMGYENRFTCENSDAFRTVIRLSWLLITSSHFSCCAHHSSNTSSAIVQYGFTGLWCKMYYDAV